MIYLFFILFVIFEQFTFKFLTFGITADISIIYHILFSVLPAILIVTICNLFKEKTNKVLSFIMLSIMCLLTAAQYIYYCIYSAPFSVYSLTQGGMGQAFDFVPTILETMGRNLGFLLFFLPIPILAILFKFNKAMLDSNKKDILIFLGVGIIVFIGTIFCVNIDKKSVDSSFEIYYNSDNLLLRANKFGLYTGTFLDIKDVILNNNNSLNLFEENIVSNSSNNLNITDISLDTRYNNELVQITSNYLANSLATNKNEYTGIFENKNLILIMAESFSPYVIDKNSTPTLYKLSNEGYNFSNFYSPLYPVSTSDGEYMALTGLIPSSNTWSLTNSSQNSMPTTLANMLKSVNYSTFAYHNHDKNYYLRYNSIPNLGFDSFVACPDLDINCDLWPESDLEMIEATTKDYIEKDNFFVYYETVSGHLKYSKDNSIVSKNYNKAKNLNYSETVKNYIASQIELDKALEKLIQDLEAANKLDDTVIAIYSDHYPYGLTVEQLEELKGSKIQNKYEMDKGSFIIWNSNLDNKNIDILGSNLDITPTLLNMFGLNFDSRLYIGKDIFSNTEKIVMFSDQSFITEDILFNNLTNKYIVLDGGKTLSPQYVENIKISVSNKFKVSNSILINDYYSYIFK